MTYRCPACKLLFANMPVQCPQCRGPVVIDVEDAQNFVSRGYNRHGAAAHTEQAQQQKKVQPSVESTKSTQKAAVPDPVIQDEDLLEALRTSYRQQHRTAQETGGPVPPAPGRSPSSAARQTQASGAVQAAPTARENPVARTSHRASENRDPFAVAEEPRVERHTASHRRRGNGTGWFAFRNAMAGIRWGTVFRVLLIGGVIALCIAAWVQRQQILDAAMDFVMSLVPCALIIAAIIWLLRKMVKG